MLDEGFFHYSDKFNNIHCTGKFIPLYLKFAGASTRDMEVFRLREIPNRVMENAYFFVYCRYKIHAAVNFNIRFL
jgi:hypothetical protein